MTSINTSRTPAHATLPTIIRTRAATSTTRAISPLQRLGRSLTIAALARLRYGRVTIIDGETRYASPEDAVLAAAPECSVRVHDPRFYSAAAFGGTLGIAETYMDGFWDTDDLPGLIETLTANYAAVVDLDSNLAAAVQPLEQLRYFLQRNTQKGSRRNIQAHYDLSNEFFGLFLDPSMTYSCAIFENGATTLEEAQVEKIDRACRRLGLNASDHLLEIGTGWGALAIHAARKYGCRVTTTTISDRQFDMAQSRINAAGLSGRITLLKQDYRTLTGTFDKLVSIEMIEAVGRKNFDGYFEACSRLLKPDGEALIQSIIIRDQYFAAAAKSVDFIKKYIFPGSCIPSTQALLTSAARSSDLRLWHLDEIGPHYVTTLQHWTRAFKLRLDEVRAMGFDDRFIRMWEYYLAYCEGAFRARHIGDVQLHFTKPMARLRGTGHT